jgi:hypothetical protein
LFGRVTARIPEHLLIDWVPSSLNGVRHDGE